MHFENVHNLFFFFFGFALNPTSWSRALQKLPNLKVKFEQVNENLYETHNCL